MSCFLWPQSASLPSFSEHSQTFFSLTTLLEAMSQRRVVTTVWWASGCVQSGCERQMTITALLRQNKLLRAPGSVHSPETFSAISPPLSHFDKLWLLRNNTLHHLSDESLFPSHTLVQAGQPSGTESVRVYVRSPQVIGDPRFSLRSCVLKVCWRCCVYTNVTQVQVAVQA